MIAVQCTDKCGWVLDGIHYKSAYAVHDAWMGGDANELIYQFADGGTVRRWRGVNNCAEVNGEMIETG